MGCRTVVQDQLLPQLEVLGIPQEAYQVIRLLPLVEVAWADDRIQAGERQEILEIARSYRVADGTAEAVLTRWLTKRPAKSYFRLGRPLLLGLVSYSIGTTTNAPPGVSPSASGNA